MGMPSLEFRSFIGRQDIGLLIGRPNLVPFVCVPVILSLIQQLPFTFENRDYRDEVGGHLA
jgi:hypothetical protein